MSCRCGRHNNDKENAPLAQLVEHLTLNQGVRGSRIVFGDIGAPGTVLFFGFNFAGQTTLQSWEHMLY